MRVQKHEINAMKIGKAMNYLQNSFANAHA